MTKRLLRFPDSVREILLRRYTGRKRRWLSGGGEWPLVISLGTPGEGEAARQVEHVRSWIDAWQQWRGSGTLEWRERRWRNLGAQRLPWRLSLNDPEDVASWLGQTRQWRLAGNRFSRLTGRWPLLVDALPRHFEMLAEYADTDFDQLESLLAWLDAHPQSNLYPRQLPVSRIDSKWLESRRGLVTDLAAALHGKDPTGMDFYQICGLRPMPNLIRLRILDPELRRWVGGLGDISAPIQEMATLVFPVRQVFIVENLQTGLAFGELPGSVVLMGLGYGVDQLAQLKWLTGLNCAYWGDIDTHGFAILNRARSYLPHLASLLMDETTLFCNKALWVEERQQHGAESLPNLTSEEQLVYRGLKQHQWGFNVRLEQERLPWREAWGAVELWRDSILDNIRWVSNPLTFT